MMQSADAEALAAARAALEAVARTYSKLESFSVEVTVASEIEDQDQRHEQRVRAWYAAPNKVRTEQGRGKFASITVTDSAVQHDYLGPAGGRYVKTPLTGIRAGQPLPGFFNPEFPLHGSPVFLFQRIAERVQSARLEQIDGMAVVTATYAPPPGMGANVPGGFAMHESPVKYTVDPLTNLVARMEGVLSHRMPAEDDVRRTRIIRSYAHAALNPTIAAATFEFTPPPGTASAGADSGIGAGMVFGTSGGRSADPKTGHGYETSQKNEMEPDGTLVERTRVKIDGVEATLERRLKVSSDKRELRITERVSTPGNPAAAQQWEATLRLL